MLKNHYNKIFPSRNRNAGGPMFFKYIYENLANTHDEFIAYNTFYCGVSGSIIDPRRPMMYNTVRVRDKSKKCIEGNYYRCCWPCSGDIMKYARVDKAKLKVPNNFFGTIKEYNVLTIEDPCSACTDSKCSNFPKEVSAFNCKNGLTQNGLRVKDSKLTKENGRLIFALFHKKNKGDKYQKSFGKQCSRRHKANLRELSQMGGMGNIFVKLSTLRPNQEFGLCLEY
ncbi:MAG: hypothetical protein VX341_03520 [Bdellovibrionota bacterium]|nr:hypothetical protein [Bdellovibrionota bacterium]